MRTTTTTKGRIEQRGIVGAARVASSRRVNIGNGIEIICQLIDIALCLVVVNVVVVVVAIRVVLIVVTNRIFYEIILNY